MDGFKKLPKMQCFKQGGSVKSQIAAFEKKEEKSEGKMDLAQDKAMVKKGVRQHESALHKGEPKTELKLKTGGRAKKAAGTVKKFEKASGQYGAKKTAEDKKNIKEAKLFNPKKETAAAPSAAKKAKNTPAKFKEGGSACAPSAAKKVKNTPAKMCGGKSVKKYSEGKMVRQAGATEAQSKFYQENMDKADKKAKAKDYEVFGSRGDAARKGMEEGRMDALGNPYKKGGKAKPKVKKYADGGAVLSDEEKAWLGGADATDPFIQARMREALGPKKPVAAARPVAAPVAARPDPAMIEDESGRGNVTAAQQMFNQTVPGSGISSSAAAPSAPVARPVARPAAAPVLPAGPSADDRLRMRNTRPYAAPNVEQDSGLEYPVKPGFFNETPGQQAAKFNRGAQQRQNIGRRIGDWLGLNKKPGV